MERSGVFLEVPGWGSPMGEAREERPGGGRVARRRGVSGNAGRREEDGPGWLHQGAQYCPGDEQLVSGESVFSDHGPRRPVKRGDVGLVL